MRLVVTGGLGFIGSNFIKTAWDDGCEILNIDSKTYAANEENICIEVSNSSKYKFIEADILDGALYESILEFEPDWIVNFAAESHVDNSILNPEIFVKTNVLGTINLLKTCSKLNKQNGLDIKFFHISTDEVYGSLALNEKPFLETNKHKPNSPYSASKSASDNFVRAWSRTYGLKTITTNCSNNYGPNQHSEKLIPKIINNAYSLNPIPIYGDGKNIRDWLFVEDHCNAVLTIIKNAKNFGETYLIGGENECSNIEIAQIICDAIDNISPIKNREISQRSELIHLVEDRPGHDLRYSVSIKKIQDEFHWVPQTSFKEGLKKTIFHYLRI
jgi:dTDP-glucose 4,6-dehydratase